MLIGLGSLALAGCGESDTATNLPFADNAETADVTEVWGEFACEAEERIELVPDGGPDGGPYRRYTVIDGDDADGERCEVGRNDHTDGPTVLYGEGERAITRLALRLPDNFPLDEDSFQVVMQMKQTQPSANGDGTPALSLEARDGKWVLYESAAISPSDQSTELWSAPAEKNVWTRFEFDVTYSQRGEEGSVRIRADLDGDGELEEDSGTITTYTLKRETEGGGDDGIEPGESVPSHLRTGLYHDPEIPCPAPEGCSVEIAGVEVVAAD